MSTPKKVHVGFEGRSVEIPIDSILPIRQIKSTELSQSKYRAVLASIKAIGLVEPLVVFPNKGTKGTYLLLDGHYRLKGLKELGRTTALCLISLHTGLCDDTWYRPQLPLPVSRPSGDD